VSGLYPTRIIEFLRRMLSGIRPLKERNFGHRNKTHQSGVIERPQPLQDPTGEILHVGLLHIKTMQIVCTVLSSNCGMSMSVLHKLNNHLQLCLHSIAMTAGR